MRLNLDTIAWLVVNQDFFHEEWDRSEVDLVLAVTELLGVLEKQNGSGGGSNASAAERFVAYGREAPVVEYSTTSGGGGLDLRGAAQFCSGNNSLSGSGENRLGSGGYVDYIFRRAAMELFGKEVGQQLVYVQGRNADFYEVSPSSSGRGGRVVAFVLVD